MKIASVNFCAPGQLASAVGLVGIDHRCVQILAAEQFSNGANIEAVFEQTHVMLLQRATMPFKPLALSGGILYPARRKNSSPQRHKDHKENVAGRYEAFSRKSFYILGMKP